MPRLQTNTLYYGDNLPILRDYIPDESIDLIYLDPPFNSNRSYNVLFRETAGPSPAQTGAFEDTWHWGDATIKAFEEVVTRGPDDTARLLNAMMSALGHSDVMAYLSMMSIRLLELRRVLKPSGSIYLHCDPTAGHYLKVLMDSVFGPKNFVNELIWRRSLPHGNITRSYGRIHDTIFFYAKDQRRATWTRPHVSYADASGVIPEDQRERLYAQYNMVEEASGRRFQATSLLNPNPDRPNLTYEFMGHTKVWRWTRDRMLRAYSEGRIYVPRQGRGVPREKRYLDEQEGFPLQDVWIDVPGPPASERLGYPTQKPLRLLERIVEASSDPGGVVLDPFCGCGTAVHAAHNLRRKWIGIDITHLAIGLIRRRLEDAFPRLRNKIPVVGAPVDLPGAKELASRDPYQFQWWALDRVDAQPITDDKRKGRDRGIDGIVPFMEGGERRRVIVSVKSGKIVPAYVRELKGTVEREKEPIGVLLTLNEPTREMKTEAVSAGSYRSEAWQRSYPKIQILTAADLLNGKKVQMPPQVSPFAQAVREREREGEQGTLGV